MSVKKNKIGDLLFKHRGFFWGVFAVLALISSAHFSVYRIIIGFLILIAGQLVRFWAAGYIPNYRTEIIGAPELIIWGPYKWVRNPLYSGNFIMGIGWALMLSWPCVVAFAAAYLALYLLAVIPAEEEFLESKFGEEYREYKKNVSSLIPLTYKPFVKENTSAPSFDREASWSCEKYSLRVNALVTVAIGVKLYFMK